jgi:hypothetical protein
MAYYIISFDPERMKHFQKRFSFLEDAVWLNDKNKLVEFIASSPTEAMFFVHLTDKREAIDELILTIRDGLISAKIVYVVEDGKAPDLKSHQMTPVGGDAYVPMQIEPSKLYLILEGLMPPEINQRGNRLDNGNMGNVRISAQQGLEGFRNDPKSKEIEKIFNEIFETKSKPKKPTWQSTANLSSGSENEELDVGVDMSDKDQELSLDDLGDLELSAEGENEVGIQEEAGLDLDLNEDIGLDLSAPDEVPETPLSDDLGMDLDLDEGFSLDDNTEEEEDDGADSLSADSDDSDDMNFSLDDDGDASSPPDLSDELSLGEEDVGLDFGGDDDNGLSLTDDLSLDDELSLDAEDSTNFGADVDLSDDALEKLKEIDAIMDFDASQIGIKMDHSSQSENEDEDFSLDDGEGLDLVGDGVDSDIETSLVSEDLDLGSLNFSNEEEEEEVVAAPVAEDKTKKKSKEPRENKEAYDGGMGRELKEISGAYSGEMERMQATISNLRIDREELLNKIQKFEDDKVLQSRQLLTMRAELDEKKIELSIIRKKLNDENSELKDRLKLFEEKKLILEEKNRIMAGELDKAAHKNKIDVKKVQMRERDLEQKLELLKSDSESQIRHRDLKILELKRKLDAMEFDVESISVQEKRSVESRFELEDKLDKAIKTLRNAITVLEDESDKSGVLEALKKNIDM